MAWGAKTSATTLSSITSTEQFFDTLVSLNPGEEAHVQVAVDFPLNPADDAVFSVYSTLDTATETWDNVPVMQFTVSNALDPSQVSFLVRGVFKFRVGVKNSGTETLASADLSYRVNGINL